MKKLILLLLFSNCCGFISFSQSNIKIDSLFSLLKNAKEDTAKINTLNALAFAYYRNEPDTAIYFSNEALQLATRINYIMGIADAHLCNSMVIVNRGEYEESLKKANYALKMYDQLLISKSSISITKIQTQKAKALNNIGIVYIEQGNYPVALKNLINSLKILEEFGDQRNIANSYNNIGSIYKAQNKYNEALKYFYSALKIREVIKDSNGIAGAYSNIATIYFDQSNYSDALKNDNVALKIWKAIGKNRNSAVSYHNIGNIYEKQGNYPQAMENYLTACTTFQQLKDTPRIAISYIAIGKLFVHQKKNSEASIYLNKGLLLAQKFGSLEDIKEGYFGLSKLDSAQGKFKQAFEHYKMYDIYRDSLFNEEKIEQIVQSQMQYDFDKKEVIAKAKQEKKDFIAQKELQRQKVVRNGFIGGFAVVLLFASVFFYQRKRIGKEKQLSDYERKRSEELLLNILPSEVASELKATGTAKAKAFTMVTVMFTDFKGFTAVSEKVPAEVLVDEIHQCFSTFDLILQKHKVEKIKTIGDAYMCASGLPVSNYTHASDMINAASEIRDFMLNRKKEKETKEEIAFELRIGIHTGPVVAGIVGIKKFAYDIWGDTVNIAARIEQNSEAGKINISGTTYELIKDKFNCIHRGKIDAKNKGKIDMYFVET